MRKSNELTFHKNRKSRMEKDVYEEKASLKEYCFYNSNHNRRRSNVFWDA